MYEDSIGTGGDVYRIMSEGGKWDYIVDRGKVAGERKSVLVFCSHM